MTYVINCRECGRPFSKFSIKSQETKCSECKHPSYKNKNRSSQTSTAATRFGTRVKSLEESIISLDETMEAWGESMIAEINTKVEEKFTELATGPLLDALKPERDQQFIELDEKVRSHMATLNTRMKMLADKVEDELNELKDTVSNLKPENITSSYYTALLRAHGDINNNQSRAGRLSPEMRNTLMAGAIDYLIDNPASSRADLLAHVWYGVSKVAASGMLTKMKDNDLIYSKGPKRAMVYYAQRRDEE